MTLKSKESGGGVRTSSAKPCGDRNPLGYAYLKSRLGGGGIEVGFCGFGADVAHVLWNTAGIGSGADSRIGVEGKGNCIARAIVQRKEKRADGMIPVRTLSVDRKEKVDLAGRFDRNWDVHRQTSAFELVEPVALIVGVDLIGDHDGKLQSLEPLTAGNFRFNARDAFHTLGDA